VCLLPAPPSSLPPSAGVADYLPAISLALSSCLSDLSSRAGALPVLSGFLWTQHTAASQTAQLLHAHRKWKNELVVRYCPLEKTIFIALTNS